MIIWAAEPKHCNFHLPRQIFKVCVNDLDLIKLLFGFHWYAFSSYFEYTLICLIYLTINFKKYKYSVKVLSKKCNCWRTLHKQLLCFPPLKIVLIILIFEFRFNHFKHWKTRHQQLMLYCSLLYLCFFFSFYEICC